MTILSLCYLYLQILPLKALAIDQSFDNLNLVFKYSDFFKNFINDLKDEGRYRVFIELERIAGSFPKARLSPERGGKEVIIWCSNDYLGMGQHPEVIDAMKNTIDEMGAGAGGTRNISGTHAKVVELERELASVTGKERALVFSSGYVANQTALSSLAKHIPEAVFISDELNHDSIIQGLRLGKAKKIVFRHNDVKHLEEILSSLPSTTPKVVVFESVYSMEGTFGHIEDICNVSDKYGAITFLDETHGVGLYGREGGGVAQALGLSDRVTIIQGGLGKGFGVVGGFISSTPEIIDFVRSTGSGFIFTTTLPPAIAAGALASIRYLRKSNSERALIQEKASYLKCSLTHAGIKTMPSTSHIVPVVIGDAKRCKAVSDTLLDEFGIYIQPINYPTVPKGTERLRITPTPFHTAEMITELVDALAEVLGREGASLNKPASLIEDGLLYVQ